MCKLLLSYSHPAEVQGVESRKPKANNEQERLNGGQQKLTSWRWELATGKWEGRGGHHSPSTVGTAFATWLLHFTQFGASSAKFLQSVLALTDVIKKSTEEGGGRSSSLLSAAEAGAPEKKVRCSVASCQTCDCEHVVCACECV